MWNKYILPLILVGAFVSGSPLPDADAKADPLAESDPQFFANFEPQYVRSEGVIFDQPPPPAPVAIVEAIPEPVPVVPVPAPVVATQHHAQDELGQYSYGYENALSRKIEVKTADGTVQGTYQYVSPDGNIVTNNYVADQNGFRSSLAPKGPVVAEPVPVAVEVIEAPIPVAPEPVPVAVPVAPAPVVYEKVAEPAPIVHEHIAPVVVEEPILEFVPNPYGVEHHEHHVVEVAEPIIVPNHPPQIRKELVRPKPVKKIIPHPVHHPKPIVSPPSKVVHHHSVNPYKYKYHGQYSSSPYVYSQNKPSYVGRHRGYGGYRGSRGYSGRNYSRSYSRAGYSNYGK